MGLRLNMNVAHRRTGRIITGRKVTTGQRLCATNVSSVGKMVKAKGQAQGSSASDQNAKTSRRKVLGAEESVTKGGR